MTSTESEQPRRFAVEATIAPWYPVTEEVTTDVWQDVFGSWPGSLRILQREEQHVLKNSNPHVYNLAYHSIWKECYRGQYDYTYRKHPYQPVYTIISQIDDIGIFRLGALMCHRLLRIQAETRAARLPRITDRTIIEIEILPDRPSEELYFHKIDASIRSLLPFVDRPILFSTLLDASNYIKSDWSRTDDFLRGAFVLYAPYEHLRKKSLSG